MDGLQLASVFIVGLLGGVHCIGMCGGIVSAFSVASAPRKAFPVAVVATATVGLPALAGMSRVVAYNTGRIASYAIAGAIAGGIAQGARTLGFIAPLQSAGYAAANLVLVALGLYLMDAWRGLAHLEAVGQHLWRRIRPLVGTLLPVDSALKAFALGGLWGWVPCGMVYSVLLTAMLSGSAWSGATLMLAFGAGTLPLLLTMGMLGTRLQEWMRRRRMHLVSGMLVLGFGVIGLARGAGGMSPLWLASLCSGAHGGPGW